jgi:tetraacyldisaccharide 4'-kinase
LLREPLSSLSRADAILITRADAINDLSDIKRQVRSHAPNSPILCCRHVINGLVDANGVPVDPIRTGRCLVLAGIGNPGAFARSLTEMGVRVVEQWSPGDHHAYTDADVQKLIGWKNIDSILTTEKDWVKLRRLPGIEKLPNLCRAMLSIDFADGDADRLRQLTLDKLKK